MDRGLGLVSSDRYMTPNVNDVIILEHLSKLELLSLFSFLPQVLLTYLVLCK